MKELLQKLEVFIAIHLGKIAAIIVLIGVIVAHGLMK